MRRDFSKSRVVGFVAQLVVVGMFAVWGESVSLAQLYKSSITATDFDFIVEDDPSVFSSLKFLVRERSEMPDKRDGKDELHKDAFVFLADFTDGSKVRIFIDEAFESEEAAQAEAMRYVHPLGKLPTSLRTGVKRLVIHHGGADTTAFSDHGLIVLYADNATKRISTHDLEETVFHESVHAAWDRSHATSERWKRAQATDNAFVTAYGQELPEREDLAESALFAFTLLHRPERIPEEDSRKIKAAIPNRILYVAELLPPDKPVFYPIVDAADADWDPAMEKFNCDIRIVGVIADILSNTLLIRFGADERQVNELTADAQDRYETSEALFLAAVAVFKIDSKELKKALKENLHCNCEHEKGDDQEARDLIESWDDQEAVIPKVRVSGTIVDENSLAVGGAVAWARIGPDLIEVVSDSDGKFDLEIPQSRGMDLLIQARSTDDSMRGFVFAPIGESTEGISGLTIQLGSVRTIEVSVVGMRREPLAGVSVGVMSEYAMIDVGLTDDSGTATLLTPEKFEVAAIFAFSRERGVDYRSFAFQQGETENQEPTRQELPEQPIGFRLGPNRNFTVAVTDDRNQPLEGATVYPWLLRKDGEADSLNVSVIGAQLKNVYETTDKNGVARFSWIPAWQKVILQFQASKPGHTYGSVNHHPESGSRDLTVQLLPLVPVSGVAKFRDGSPAAGLSMRFHGRGLKEGESFGNSSVGIATTDSDGRFRMMLHPHQSYLGVVHGGEFAFAESSIFAVTGSPPDKELEFVIRPAIRIFGRVTVGKDNQPISGQLLMLTHYDDLEIPQQGGTGTFLSQPALASGANSNEQGAYEFKVGGGKYWMRAPISGELVRFELIDETEKEINFHSDNSGLGILAIELVGDNSPVTGAVQAHYAAANARGYFGFEKFESDIGGKIDLERELLPVVLFGKSSDGNLVGMADVEAEQATVRIDMVPAVSARGRLVDEDGYPMPGEELTYGRQLELPGDEGRVYYTTPFQLKTETGEDGTFFLEGLVPKFQCKLKLTVTRENGESSGWLPIHDFAPDPEVAETDLGDVVIKRKSLRRPLRPRDKMLDAFRDKQLPVAGYTTALSNAKSANQNVLILFGDPSSISVDPLARLFFDDRDIVQLLDGFSRVTVDMSDKGLSAAQELAEMLKFRLEPSRFEFQILIVDQNGVRAGGIDSLDLVDTRTGSMDKARLINLLTETIAQPLDGDKLLGDAIKHAKQGNKRVILVETETSTAQSLIFSRFLNQTEAIWTKDYILVCMDRRWTGSENIMQKYRGDSEGGVPWYAILDSDGNSLATSNDSTGANIGLPNDTAGIQHLSEMLMRTTIRLTKQEIDSMVGELDDR